MRTIRGSIAGLLCLAGLYPGVAAGQDEQMQSRGGPPMVRMDEATFNDWLARWEKNITGSVRSRYCDTALGEEIGWLMMPYLNGFYYGYMATRNSKWVDLLVDWTDSWIRRAVREPDGYIGWPKRGAAGTEVDSLNDYNADSMLGEAMVLRPIVLMADEILKTAALKTTYGAKAEAYIKLAESVYEKWDRRGGWRDTDNGGMISVVLPFGIDDKTGKWTAGYETRNGPGSGFSHPNNKANHVACWLLAMGDATGKRTYTARAEKWFKLMKSRMKTNDSGTYEIWNYWEPAGAWDYKADGSPKHWVGVHPKGGYYSIDTDGIVDAHAYGLVFTQEDVDRLVATALATKRYWSALTPHSAEIQRRFEESMKPDGWGGLGGVPKYLALQVNLREDAQTGKAPR